MGKFKLQGGNKVITNPITNMPEVARTQEASINMEELVAKVKAAMPEPSIINNITQVIQSEGSAPVIMPKKDKKARLHSKLLHKKLNDITAIAEDNSKITSKNFQEMAVLIQQDRAIMQQLHDNLHSSKNEATLLSQRMIAAHEDIKALQSKKPEEIQVVMNNTEIKEVNNKLVYVLLAASLLMNLVILLKN